MPSTHTTGTAGPQIDYAAGVEPLPPAAAAVLQSLFTAYDRLAITQELGGGFTQSRVFVVQPNRIGGGVVLPLVVKIGPVWLIEQEQVAYRRHIRDKLAGRIELVDAALVGDWGGLSYRLAGDGQFKHESLAQFFNQTGSRTLVDVVTGRLFKRLETLWRDAHPAKTPYLGGQYDLLLPVHLVIRPQPLPPDTTTYRLTPTIFGDDYLETDAAVQIEGFEVIEVNAEAKEVTVDLPVEAGRPQRSHRLRLHPVADVTAFQVGEIQPTLTGVVTQTRRERLQLEINHAFGPVTQLDLTGQTVTLPDGRKLFNPLAQLPNLLHDWPVVNIGTLHGDLNLQNILVDPVSGDVTLIDFANAGEDHILRDLLHLETNVIIGLLPGAALELGVPPEHIVPLFFERLHRAAAGEEALFQPPRLWHPALQKPYLFLAAIRRQARAYLAVPDDWGEYYRGLALHLLGALKYKNLHQAPEAPLPVQFAFLGSAAAVSLWSAGAGQSLPTPTRLAALSASLARSLQGVPEFDADAAAFILTGGAEMTNPITQLSHLLPPWLADDLPSLHGRLNVAKPAAESAALFAADIEGLPADDRLLHTLLRLEIEVVVGLLPQALLAANRPPDTIHFLFYERLHRAMRDESHQFDPPQSLPHALDKPFKLLAAVRRRAARLLPKPADQADYYRGLALHLLGALTHPGLADRPQPGLAKQVTLLAAALATDLWQTPTPRPQPPNPYQGLHAFQEADAPFFFGREQFVQQLAEAVEQQPLIAVTGPSGSGKSSVVFAGLVPHLQERGSAEDRSSSWLTLSFRPGGAPFDELARVLAEPLGQNAEALADALQHRRSKLPDLAAQLLDLQPQAKRLLLIIDQFEELYTLCPDTDLRRQFIDALLAGGQGSGVRDQRSEIDSQQSSISQSPNLLIANRQSPFSILLTLRADFLSKALAYRPLADALQPGINLLGAMTATELAQAIECPAEKMGISFESGLVKTILADVGDEPGRLPLLEFALTRLWQDQRDGQLTTAAYQASGGVEGAVTHYADEIYAQLTTEQQVQARHVFTQLVQPGAGTEDTRRIASRTELEAAWPLVQHLADARLVVTDQNAAGDEVVEVVHEALIQNWTRLHDWMEADRAFRAWQERLRGAIHQWQRAQQDEGGLLRGAPLAEAEEWLAQRETDLSAVERDFVLRSITLREQQAAQIETDRQRQLRQAQERAEEQTQAANQLRRRAIWLGTALVLLLLAVIAAAGFGVSARNEANRAIIAEQTSQAEATRAANNLADAQIRGTEAVANLELARTQERQAANARTEAENNLEKAQVNATAAFQAQQTAEANAAQEQIARQQAVNNGIMAEQNAGRAAANLSTAEHNATQEALARELADTNLATAEYNATQEALARGTAIAEATRSAQAEKTAQAEATKAIEAENTAQAESTRAVEARQTAEANQATAVAERNRADNQVRIGVSRQLAALGLSLLDEHVDTALLLSLEAYKLENTTEAKAALFSGLQASSRLINLQRGHGVASVLGLAINSNRQIMASGDADGALILWNISQPGNPQPLGQPVKEHTNWVQSLAFSPIDITILASASQDGTVILWDISNPHTPRLIRLPFGEAVSPVYSVAFSPDGNTLAAGNQNGLVFVWDISDPNNPVQKAQSPKVHSESVQSIVFLNNNILVSGSVDKTIRLWDVSEPGSFQQIGQPLQNSSEVVSLALTSNNGQILAVGGFNGEITLWDVSNPANPKIKGQPLRKHKGWVYSLAFSSDGRILASGGGDGAVVLWDMTYPDNPQPLGDPLKGGSIIVYSVVFYSADNMLAAGQWNGTIALWDINTPGKTKPWRWPIVDQMSPVRSVALHSDRQLMASGHLNGNVLLWSTKDNDKSELIGQLPIKNKGLVEDVVFSADGNTLISGTTNDPVSLWDIRDPANPRQLALIDTNSFGFMYSVNSNSDQSLVAIAGLNKSLRGTITLWSIQNPVNPQLIGTIDTGKINTVNTIAFSPDGSTLASGGVDNKVTLWDIRNPGAPQQLGYALTGHTKPVNEVAFSRDGLTLASGSADSTVILWDISDPSTPQQLGDALTGHTAAVNSIAFSRDGLTLASGSADNTVILWDIRDPSAPQQLGNSLMGHTGVVNSIAFNTTGNLLVSGGEDGAIILTDTGIESWQDLACRKIGRELTQTEIDKYVPQQFQPQTGTACSKYLQELPPTLINSETRLSLSRVNQSSPTSSAQPGITNDLSGYVQPVPVACGNRRFWASGLMSQSEETKFNNLKVQLPSRTQPLEIWLVVEGMPDPPPIIAGESAQLVAAINDGPRLSIWATVITPTITTADEATISVQSHASPTAIFLFEPDRLVFEDSSLTALFQIDRPLTYRLKLPATNSNRVDLLIPLLGLTYPDDARQLNRSSTELIVEYNGQRHRIIAEEPNLGNGLFMAQLEVDLNPSMPVESDRLLSLSATTNSLVYMFSPQPCSFPITDEIPPIANPTELKVSQRLYLPLILIR